MKNILLFLLLTALMAVSCKSKKAASGDEEVSIEDLIGLFPETILPYQVTDTFLLKKQKDTSVVNYNMLTRFVPDTVFQKQFGKKTNPRIYPLGKVVIKKAETYLFVKAYTTVKKAAYILVFDKEQQFIVAKPLIITEINSPVSQQAEMDTKYTLTTMRRRKGTNGQSLYQKDAFVYNSEGVFTLILTESNDMSRIENAVINPIDTLPRKNKYSGDYAIGSKSFVSIRDGKSAKNCLFFVHFEKDKSTCIGELKGEAVFTGATKAVFRQKDGPCVIDFSFTASRVSLKESGPCGTYRDIKCFFEGSFPKKKTAKAKKVSK